MFGRDSGTDDDFETRRERMVESLAESGRIEHDSTVEALRAVSRHEFVREGRRDDAYTDRPLPIGADQTISAPHMIGIMCDLLELEAGDEVLEVGTGSSARRSHMMPTMCGAEMVWSAPIGSGRSA